MNVYLKPVSVLGGGGGFNILYPNMCTFSFFFAQNVNESNGI